MISYAGPRRICFYISEMSDGGAQRQAALLAQELGLDPRIEFLFVTARSGIQDGLLSGSHLRTISLDIGSNFNPLVYARLRRILRRERVEILVSWLHPSDIQSGIATIGLRRCKWILTERDSSYPSEWRYRVRKMLGRRALAVIANSRAGVEYWDMPPSRSFQVDNIVLRPTTEGCTNGDSPGRGKVLFVGRLEEQKNVVTVCRAFCLLALRNPGMQFEIIGEGSQRAQLLDLLSDSGNPKNVVIRGYIDNARSEIEAAAVLVSLSLHEGMPNVVLEALASGTRAVLSNIPEHVELAGPDYEFYVTEFANVEASVEAIEKAIHTQSILPGEEHARSRVVGMTPTAVAEAYLRVFEDVLEGG